MAMEGIGEAQTTLGDGTEALPQYSFSGDPDSGMWRSSTDQLSFSTRADIAGMFVDSGSALPRLAVKGCIDLGPGLGGGDSAVFGDDTTGLALSVTNGSSFFVTEGILVSRRGYHLYPGAAGSEGYYRRMHHTIQTTNATPTTFLGWPLTDDHVGLYNAMVVGRGSGGIERCAYSMQTMAHREGGGSAVLGTPVVLLSAETTAGMDAAFGVSGNDLRITVTGKAATTINWALTFDCVNSS